MELLIFLAMMVLTHNLNNPPLVVVVLLPNTFNFALIINLMVLLLLSFAQWCLILPSTFKSPGLFNMPKLIILNALLLPSVFEAPWTIPDLVLPPLWMLNLSFLTFVAL